jgi:hypothetical protein
MSAIAPAACKAEARPLYGVNNDMPTTDVEPHDYVILGSEKEWGSFKPHTLQVGEDKFEVTLEHADSPNGGEYIARGLELSPSEESLSGVVLGKVGEHEDKQDVCVQVETVF